MKYGGNRVQGKQDGETFLEATESDFASAAEDKGSRIRHANPRAKEGLRFGRPKFSELLVQ